MEGQLGLSWLAILILLRVGSNGNVGIGTPTRPNARLTVETSGPDVGDFTFATGVQGTVINNRGAPGFGV
jgi:hypothetical protein